MSILHLNVRSVNNEPLALKVLLRDTKSDIFCRSKHYLQGVNSNAVILDNFVPICHSYLTLNIGGGTAIFARRSLEFQQVNTNITPIGKQCEFCVAHK